MTPYFKASFFKSALQVLVEGVAWSVSQKIYDVCLSEYGHKQRQTRTHTTMLSQKLSIRTCRRTYHNIIHQDDISESPEYHPPHFLQGAWRDWDHDWGKARNVHSS